MKNIILVIIAGLIIFLGAWLLFSNRAEAPATEILNENENATGTPLPEVKSSTTPSTSGLIKISSPTPGTIIKSPLKVSGEARGSWYFEASAPFKVLDANGKVLGESHIEATSDWMTTEFVPFKGEITFSSSTTAEGTIVFSNDNPSGLPQNDKSFIVPIRFR